MERMARLASHVGGSSVLDKRCAMPAQYLLQTDLIRSSQFVKCMDYSMMDALKRCIGVLEGGSELNLAQLVLLSRRGHLWGDDSETMRSYCDRIVN